jgi:hypothetical protein
MDSNVGLELGPSTSWVVPSVHRPSDLLKYSKVGKDVM